MKYRSVTEWNRCRKCKAMDKLQIDCGATKSKPWNTWVLNAVIIGYKIR